MKVLAVTNLYPPEFLGGYELACAQMVSALRSAGHEVVVVTSVPVGAIDLHEPGLSRVLELPPIYDGAQMQSVSTETRQYFHLHSCTVNAANVRALGATIEEFRPDVAYLWNVLGIGGLAVLGLLDHQGVPWVWHLADATPRELCGFGTTGPEVARELGRVFPGRYIVCSSHVLGEIRAAGVELGGRVDVIPNWVYGSAPPPRSEFFGGGELRILTASGTLVEAKGTHILIEAAARLRDHGFANFTIDIYGQENDPRFRGLVHRHDVAGLVRLMGPRSHEEMIELYHGYDVFAFPTWTREPTAFAPLEAASAGCVPLFTHDCGNAEWMIDEVDCLKAPRTADAFAHRLAQILVGDVDVAAIGRRAQAVVWREFHISAAAAQVEAILTAAAAERRVPRGNAGEYYALARYAEGVLHALLQEA